jgi:hypothetical protein
MPNGLFGSSHGRSPPMGEKRGNGSDVKARLVELDSLATASDTRPVSKVDSRRDGNVDTAQ